MFGGTLNTTARESSPGSCLGNADYLFNNGDLLGAHLKLDTSPTFSIGQYGINGRLGLDGGHTPTFHAQALPPADTLKLNVGLQFANCNLLNVDWMRAPIGQVCGDDGAFKLCKDSNGTANFRVDEHTGSANFDTKLKFNPDFSLNADWNRTAAGQIYGIDESVETSHNTRPTPTEASASRGRKNRNRVLTETKTTL